MPTWRARDVTREIDLVEEVARFRLDDVPFTLPRRTAMFGRLTPAQRLRRTVEDVLAGAGFSEAYTWSLVAGDPDPDALELPEPISAEQRGPAHEPAPRASSRPRGTTPTLGDEDVALFEVARVYLPSGDELPDERWHVAGVVVGDSDERAFARAKGAVETLFAALRLRAALRAAGRPGRRPSTEARVTTLGDGIARLRARPRRPARAAARRRRSTRT